jgi:exosortase
MGVVAANLHYVFGWGGIRHFGFVVGFLFVALPMPSAIQNPLVGGLQSEVAAINVEVLNLIGIPAEQIGSLIRLPNGTVGVDEACSGIRSLQSTVMATLFIGHLTLRRISLRCALLVLGIGLAVFGNVIRSLFLTYTANAQGLSAIDKFHDAAGWSILLFTAGGVAALAVLLGKAEKHVSAACPRSTIPTTNVGPPSASGGGGSNQRSATSRRPRIG